MHMLINAIESLADAFDRNTKELRRMNDRVDAQPQTPEDMVELANRVMESSGLDKMLVALGESSHSEIVTKPGIVKKGTADAA